MPSIISAGTTANTGLNLTADTSGNLVFQTNGNTTAMTIDTSQNVTYANGVSFTGVIGGNGANISSMNASNLTSGTVANARTTAASANGASTIVLRDSNGSFAGNVATLNSVTVGTVNSSFDTNVLFVDATNNKVGIGTSSPSNPLDVVSDSGAAAMTMRGRSSDNISTFRFTSNDAATTYGQIQSRSNGMWVNAVANIPLQFFTNDTERGRFDTSGNLQFNSGYGSVAVAYGCRAWISFNGSSGAINGSGNISSVSNNATGDWTINFSTSMPDGNYSIVGMVRSDNDGNPAANPAMRSSDSPAAGSCRVFFGVSNSRIAFTLAMFAVFR